MSTKSTIRKIAKAKIIATYKSHDKDTGSNIIQRNLLKHKLFVLTEHQKIHPKDITIKRTITSIKYKINHLDKQMQ